MPPWGPPGCRPTSTLSCPLAKVRRRRKLLPNRRNPLVWLNWLAKKLEMAGATTAATGSRNGAGAPRGDHRRGRLLGVPWLEARLARIEGSSASRKRWRRAGAKACRRAMDRRPSSAAMDVRIATQVLTAVMEQRHRADLDAEMFWAPILVDPLFALAAADAGGMKTTQAGRGAPAPKTGFRNRNPLEQKLFPPRRPGHVSRFVQFNLLTEC
jgi:hypothetical protein